MCCSRGRVQTRFQVSRFFRLGELTHESDGRCDYTARLAAMHDEIRPVLKETFSDDFPSSPDSLIRFEKGILFF